ncbi:hypothetical protein Leryth_024671 [Lithospermum erythrorhizon]|nr:hypothetical protein Leryth_024671 [Lithospermum erythrorhizon]
MGIIGYFEYFLIVFFIISLYYLRTRRFYGSSIPTNWPLFGMLPSIIQNAYRVHEFTTEVLQETGGTFLVKGPWLSNSDILVTSDPANIHHIFSRNFSNYPKGPEFREIFELLGDGIFNADYKLWEMQRKTTMALMNHANFHRLLEGTTWGKIDKGLLQVLGKFCNSETEFDLQDIFHRHVLPEKVWKLQKWLGIGKERQLMKAWNYFDQFLYPIISLKQEELKRSTLKGDSEEFGFLTAFLKLYEGKGKFEASGDLNKFMKDTFLNLIFAGRDTTGAALTWLFWLISKNPEAEYNILKEIKEKLLVKDEKKWRLFSAQESHQLVYLHGALCESLRLFPPISFEHKAPEKADLLPSGHRLKPYTRVMISFYCMGRMESIWGKDCLDFKPERWISERGASKHEPSFKFPAFNVGPRTCIGKEMAFIQMKMVAASVLYHYHVEVVKDHPVFPNPAVLLQMKDGLMVRLIRRI